ncbi:MAG: glycerophosphodiester phosphodiesterase family protein [Candidatus Poribacteria bacterium]|nr:glycerophosphodiester phosphodiesterase family protein [Candidatus Poribacteria bacterium]
MCSWIRIAHRGASGSAPENTLAAFKKALEIGVDAVELDLHGTADGEIVVIHDSTLDRTTDLHGRINETTLETIQNADAGGWFDTEFAGEPIPTLTEALACIGKETIAVLEIKDPLIAEAVVAKIHETHTLDVVVVISFYTAVLQTIRALEPRIATGWLIGNSDKHVSPIQLCQQLGELGSSLLNVNHELITAEFAYEVLRRGVALWCWTVDDIARMREMQRFGVQGITSNYPERFAIV